MTDSYAAPMIPGGHIFIDGQELINEIMDHPRCTFCNTMPGIVVEKDGAWMAVTAHVNCPALHG